MYNFSSNEAKNSIDIVWFISKYTVKRKIRETAYEIFDKKDAKWFLVLSCNDVKIISIIFFVNFDNVLYEKEKKMLKKPNEKHDFE